MFNICKDTYTECLASKTEADLIQHSLILNKIVVDHCENIQVGKNLVSTNNTFFIEMSLPKLCDTENVIDKVIFELVCSEWRNNEHFELKEEINNCTVKLLLYTHLVCGKEVSMSLTFRSWSVTDYIFLRGTMWTMMRRRSTLSLRKIYLIKKRKTVQ